MLQKRVCEQPVWDVDEFRGPLIDSCPSIQQTVIDQKIYNDLGRKHELEPDADRLNIWYVLLLHYIVYPYVFMFILRVNVRDDNDDV